MVLWDAAHRQGRLRINRLAPPAEGKDYQLWVVEKDRKDAVSAGVFHVDADGTAEVPFRPVEGGRRGGSSHQPGTGRGFADEPWADLVAGEVLGFSWQHPIQGRDASPRHSPEYPMCAGRRGG